MSATVSDLRDTPVGRKAKAFDGDSEVSDLTPDDDVSLRERLALTTKAAWEFTSKAPRWARRQVASGREATSDASEAAMSKLGKVWGKFRSALSKIDFAQVAWIGAAVLVWAFWNFIIWFLIMYWVALAFMVNPVLGWCIAVFLCAWGFSFTTAYTQNTINFLDNKVL
jgi:hypothetical protein